MDEGLLRLDDPGFTARIGRVIREARELAGWTQRDLAIRAGSSQAVISRIESGHSPTLDLGVVTATLAALGMRGGLSLDARHLDDRRRQRDPVHARLVGYVARRLERAGWRVATEVPVGHPVPRGWIDILASREADGAGLMTEVKGDVPDMGGLQRQVAFYARSAISAARPLGWRIEELGALVVALDSELIRHRLRDNEPIIRQSFPGSSAALMAWVASSTAPPPRAPTLALADPLSRRLRWLRPWRADERRRPAPYVDYADAARALRPPPRPGGQPRDRPPSWRSRTP